MQMDRSHYKQPSVETNVLHVSMKYVFTSGNHDISLLLNGWIIVSKCFFLALFSTNGILGIKLVQYSEHLISTVAISDLFLQLQGISSHSAV